MSREGLRRPPPPEERAGEYHHEETQHLHRQYQRRVGITIQCYDCYRVYPSWSSGEVGSKPVDGCDSGKRPTQTRTRDCEPRGGREHEGEQASYTLDRGSVEEQPRPEAEYEEGSLRHTRRPGEAHDAYHLQDYSEDQRSHERPGWQPKARPRPGS